jgi:hypothetical protein
MGTITLIAPRSPHDEQRNTVEHADTLVATLAICVSFVLSSEQVAIEKPFQIRKVNSVYLDIRATLPLIPGVHR